METLNSHCFVDKWQPITYKYWGPVIGGATEHSAKILRVGRYKNGKVGVKGTYGQNHFLRPVTSFKSTGC